MRPPEPHPPRLVDRAAFRTPGGNPARALAPTGARRRAHFHPWPLVRAAQTRRAPHPIRRNFTVVVRSSTGGPSSNQIEGGNTKTALHGAFFRPRAVQPDRGRVTSS